MCSFFSFASAALLLLAFASAVLGLLQYRRLLTYMAVHQPRTLAALGEPQVVTAEGATSDVAAFKFIVRREYLALRDGRLSTLAMRVRGLLVLEVVLLVAVVGLQAAPGTNFPFLGLECLLPK